MPSFLNLYISVYLIFVIKFIIIATWNIKNCRATGVKNKFKGERA